MTSAIVAIGGGDIKQREPIHREIIRLSGKKNPNLLFIPTASSDSQVYWEEIQNYLGKKLGCGTDVLFLIKERPSPAEIANKIRWANIVYVGGGNTLKMMRLWRRLGVDRLLKQAYGRGTVLCGVSAGSICWFDSGHSDSMSYYHPNRWKYINVRGLGLLPGIHCPHYDGKTRGIPRRKDFQNMIRKIGGLGIAVENHCALEFIEGRLHKVIRDKSAARAFKVFKRANVVVEEAIP